MVRFFRAWNLSTGEQGGGRAFYELEDRIDLDLQRRLSASGDSDDHQRAQHVGLATATNRSEAKRTRSERSGFFNAEFEETLAVVNSAGEGTNDFAIGPCLEEVQVGTIALARR